MPAGVAPSSSWIESPSASQAPWNESVCALVMPSLFDAPESDAASSAGRPGAFGATSSVHVVAALALPARSVAVTENTRWLPLAPIAQLQLPLASAFVEQTVLAFNATAIAAFASAVPAIVNGGVAGGVGEVTTGAFGAMTSELAKVAQDCCEGRIVLMNPRVVARRERGRDVESDIDLELQFHIDARTDDLVRLGLGRDEARRAALAEFGDVKRYETETVRIDRGYARTTRIKELLWSVWFDFAYALRGLRRSPGFAAAAVFTLALGIGANTAVWTILDALMRQPLPIDRPDELHAVRRADDPNEDYLNSFQRFQRLQAVMPDPQRLTAMSAFAFEHDLV